MRVTCFVIVSVLIAPFNAGLAHNSPRHLAQRPAAPQVTVGANIKQLRFDWTQTPRAQYYKLLKDRDGHSGFRQIGRNIPGSLTSAIDNIAVHFHDWSDARYIVAACNKHGCTRSGEISTTHLMLDSIGYLKSGEPKFADFFGDTIALSGDGKTLAVRAYDDPNSGIVWVYRRTMGAWHQEELPILEARQPGSNFGYSLRLSDDGNTLAVGASWFHVPGGPTETRCDPWTCEEVSAHGAVHIFKRNHAGAWRQEALLHAPELRIGQTFGVDLALSGDGRTLVAGSSDGPNDVTAHYVLRRTASGWQHETVVRPLRTNGRCFDPALTTDGQRLFLACDFHDVENQTRSGEEIQIRERTAGAWPLTASLPYSVNHSGPFQFTYSVDRHGRTIAMREWVDGRPVISIYTPEVSDSSSWTLHSRLTEAAPNVPFYKFGRGNVVLSGDGTTLVVGDFQESSAGAGILETPSPSGVQAGGAFVFRRSNDTWNFRALIKAPNPDNRDEFGAPLAVSIKGTTIAIAARVESSAAQGIDGDQNDNSLSSAGAVYLY